MIAAFIYLAGAFLTFVLLADEVESWRKARRHPRDAALILRLLLSAGWFVLAGSYAAHFVRYDLLRRLR